MPISDITALKAALESAGCTPDMSAEELCDALTGVFPTISFDGLTGTGMTWNANGEVSKLPAAVVIKGGVYVSANAAAAEGEDAAAEEAPAEGEASDEAEAPAEGAEG